MLNPKMPNQEKPAPKNILQKYPIVPAIFFILFSWGLLHLITQFKPALKQANIQLTAIAQDKSWELTINNKNIKLKYVFKNKTFEGQTEGDFNLKNNKTVYEFKIDGKSYQMIFLPKSPDCATQSIAIDYLGKRSLACAKIMEIK